MAGLFGDVELRISGLEALPAGQGACPGRVAESARNQVLIGANCHRWDRVNRHRVLSGALAQVAVAMDR